MKAFTVALLATACMAWETENIPHSHYQDIIVTRPYTQDATQLRTISDQKNRQELRKYEHKTQSTVWDDQVENRSRNNLITNPTIKKQQVNSTAYSTSATQGSQDRTRFDVVQQSRDTQLESFQTNQKAVGIIDSEVAYDTVTETRDNYITINKLCDAQETREVKETIMEDQIQTIDVTKTRPVEMTTLEDQIVLTDVEETNLVDQIVLTDVEETMLVDQIVLTDVEETMLVDKIISEDVEVTNLVDKIISEDVEVTNLVDKVITEDIEVTNLVDKVIMEDIMETIMVDVVKQRQVQSSKTVTETTYITKQLLVHSSDSDDCGDWNDWCDNKCGDWNDWCKGQNGHKVITKKIPKTISKQVPITITEDYTVQEPQTITKTISKTIQVPVKSIEQRSKTIQVPVKSIEQRQKTIQVPVKSIEQRQKTIQVPVTSTRQVEKTIQVPQTSIRQVEKTIQVEQTSIRQVEKTIQVPVTTVSQEEYTVQEQITVQVPREITRTEVINVKKPCQETINHQTTTTQERPRTVLLNKTKNVNVESIRSDPITQVLNVSQPRIEQASTQSMMANRMDSSRIDEQAFNSQELQAEDYQVIRKIPRTVENSRLRSAYDNVSKTVSRQTPFQAVSNHLQEVVRQQRLDHAHGDLGSDLPSVIASRDAGAADLLANGNKSLAPLGSSKNYGRQGGAVAKAIAKGYSKGYKKW